MSSLSWSPFTLVAELPPDAAFEAARRGNAPGAFGATVLSYKSYPTCAYESGIKYNDQWRNHSVAVIWDEDRDTRVLDALAYLVYSAPRTASRISAIAERKGYLTVWAAWTGRDDWSAFTKASENTQVLDSWPMEIRDLVLPLKCQRFDIPEWIGVRDGHTDRVTPQRPDYQDGLVLHINELCPLGWWGQPKPKPLPDLTLPGVG